MNEAYLDRNTHNPDLSEILEKRKIKLYDTTLRDGEQMPGITFSPKEKLEIAIALDEAGVPQIEPGFPPVSEEERNTIRKIANQGLNADILTLGRMKKEDIDMAADCGADVVLLFLGVSPLHLKYKFKKSIEELIAPIPEIIDHARDRGLVPSFSCEDATRTPVESLFAAFDVAVDAGAKRIGFTDTVGCGTPEGIGEVVGALKDKYGLPVSFHGHNDFGLAVPNAVAAVRAGAEHIAVTVNGIGERSGNLSIEQFVSTISFLYNVDLGIDTTKLGALSALVSKYTGVPVPKNLPIVGENVFTHESGIHVAAVLENPATYEPIPPEDVGNTRRILFGKHSGRKVVAHYLTKWNIPFDDEQLKLFVEVVKMSGGKVGLDERKLSMLASQYFKMNK